MHGFSSFKIAIKHRKGSGKTLTFLRKSIPNTILKSSMGVIMKSTFLSHELIRIATPHATLYDGLATKLTALSQLSFLDYWSSSLYASSFEIKI